MADYGLYWRKGSGSMVVEAALRLIGVGFDRHEVPDTFAAEFTAINPAAKVPVLVLPTGQVIAESAAILLALDDAFPEARLLPPQATPARNAAVQWLVFMTANIYPAMLRFYYPERHTADAAPEAIDAVRRKAAADMTRDFAQLAAAIAGPFLVGERMTITDVYAAMLADWHEPARAMPDYAELTAALLKHPAVAEAWASHGFGT
ncbi:hypothetical protein AWJ14_13065 [Hoeflea olei]|uniref:GST N-terminal domain-containing protein n=2 Tax=Hoeflea olei TaxID=1480615 RepID=A0A1C1YUW2_9HYPH|nr:hypothetical protein AWJ14_13065 [Hoeflea olei]